MKAMTDEQIDHEVRRRLSADPTPGYFGHYQRLHSQIQRAALENAPLELIVAYDDHAAHPGPETALRLRNATFATAGLTDAQARDTLASLINQMLAGNAPPEAASMLRGCIAGCNLDYECREFIAATERRTDLDLQRAAQLAVVLRRGMIGGLGDDAA